MAANSSTTTSQVGTLNKMSAFPNEKRTDYVNRLLTQILAVESLGRAVDDATRKERLLNGLKGNSAYEFESKQLELMNLSWTQLVAQLHAWEREEDHKAKEAHSANMATSSAPVITCHSCGAAGHKRPQCPLRVTDPPNKRGGRGGGKGGGGKGNGGRGGSGRGGGGRFSQHRGGRSGYGNDYPPGENGRKTGTHQKRKCYLCGNSNHTSDSCDKAKDFRAFLKSKKSRHQDEEEYSDMICEETIGVQEFSQAVIESGDAKYLAAADSGTSSHVVKESILSNPVDHSRATPIRTAKQGEQMYSLGRVTEGEIIDGLAMEDDVLEKNLISISKFDLAGYMTVFFNGICKVTDPSTKRTILEAKLYRTSNLYMFDIRTLLKPESANITSTKAKMTV